MLASLQLRNPARLPELTINMPKKTETKAQPAPQAAPRENRYLRAARVIIEEGENVDVAELAIKAEMSEATAGHCREAFVGVTAALRDAKLLPAKAAPIPQVVAAK